MSGAPYPAWICAPCGDRVGRPSTHWSTWHPGQCGWCGATASVTEPRDYGYPPAPASSGERPSPLPITADPAAVPAAPGPSPLRNQETARD